MDTLDTREWLLTNGLGSFASGTVCDARTRTYHGWLIAALEPPCQRTLLLSHLEATLEVGGQVWQLGTNFWQGGTVAPAGFQLLRSFEREPAPTWTWGEGDWQLRRRLLMPHRGLEKVSHNILIEYEYRGISPAILKLRPLIADRDFHYQQSSAEQLHFSRSIGEQEVVFQGFRNGQALTAWRLRWSSGEYDGESFWYWNYYYPEENKRGLNDIEDLYNPGCLTVVLQPRGCVVLEASVGEEIGNYQLDKNSFEKALLWENQRLTEVFGKVLVKGNNNEKKLKNRLLKASDQFIVYRASIDGPTVIAGYPWFNDWGRDTLIALPGLALATGRFELAKGLLRTFGKYCKHGLIPNAFPDAGSQPFYNSVDAALWWVEILGLYLEATQDWQFLREQYGVVRQIYKGFSAGSLYNIGVDASDGLVMWDALGAAVTWMDVVLDGVPVTPRRGKPVEINALWYSLLCWGAVWAGRLAAEGGEFGVKYQNQAVRYAHHAEIVKASLQKFWNAKKGYLYDVIDPEGVRDGRIRPNAVLALSLSHCAFSQAQGRQVMEVARERLLTPYGLRSLDWEDGGYKGRYEGGRYGRDRAYHQGTVWSWLIGAFVRGWVRFYPEVEVPVDWGAMLQHFCEEGCIDSVSEIFDGDAPHFPQGTFAQAWSVAELLRHWPGMELD
ncbi:amylo-alpha-1,6-glucosidase [Ancylothrix sp. C2]|uniref:amylo-alpha-1,6-glucosidase n=1 Tax=Ancylothrix sp. D3o TaxID=2953691 RepID=UPI0021BB23F7|nr:amylo-alpha-1,6-glucosidase [Ancylothrix sp. D3o]MCT7949312.1 amylo-alpha-1,6-glucosidase [Ancylothrix sp. D3o]